ncbi:MAG: S-layer homology domain-containing protein, partial [Clostridiales Family XIII bacterium]|nr:S-layer homology domain-containing protein [Clostridiales Family XIII bacterium]
NVAGYAKKAVQALYGSAIINGTDKNAFAPNKSASRAEVAAMLHRFVNATS